MKKRKVFATLLAAVSAASLLTGCGGGNNKTNTETQADVSGDNSGAGNSAEASGDKVNLRFVSWLTAYQDLDKKVAEAYMAEHPNVTVTFDYYGDMTATEYYKKVDLMVMGGEEMDILMTSAFPEHAQRAGSGAYLPLEEYFEKEGIKPSSKMIV